MLLTLTLLGCPDPTYDVPTTYTLPTEDSNFPNPQKPPHDGPPSDGTPQEQQNPEHPPNGTQPPDGEPDPNGDHKHVDVPHRNMSHNRSDAGVPEVAEGQDPPPPPKEDLEQAGDEPPPLDSSLKTRDTKPPTEAPLDPSPNAISFEDGCIISHQWEALRAEDVEKISLTTKLDIETPVQTLLIDIISPATREVQVGLICPSKEINVNIPKNLGNVQLAIFVDNNNNGPSADDIQALSVMFTVGEDPISLQKIPLSGSTISFYNFKED